MSSFISSKWYAKKQKENNVCLFLLQRFKLLLFVEQKNPFFSKKKKLQMFCIVVTVNHHLNVLDILLIFFPLFFFWKSISVNSILFMFVSLKQTNEKNSWKNTHEFLESKLFFRHTNILFVWIPKQNMLCFSFFPHLKYEFFKVFFPQVFWMCFTNVQVCYQKTIQFDDTLWHFINMMNISFIHHPYRGGKKIFFPNKNYIHSWV